LHFSVVHFSAAAATPPSFHAQYSVRVFALQPSSTSLMPAAALTRQQSPLPLKQSSLNAKVAAAADSSGTVRVSMSLAVVKANPASSALNLSEVSVTPRMRHVGLGKNSTRHVFCTSIHMAGTRNASDDGPAPLTSADVW